MPEQPKKLLYMAPDMSTEEGKAAFHYVCKNFIKKMFLQNITLFVVFNTNQEALSYSLVYMCQCLGTGCSVQGIARNRLNLSEVMKQADGLVTYGELETLDDLDLAYLVGCKVIAFDDIEDAFPANSDVTKLKEELKNFCDVVFKQLPPDEYEYVFLKLAWGESIITFYWLKNLKNITPKKIVIFTMQQERVPFFEMCPYVDEVALIQPALFGYFSAYYIDLPFVRHSLREWAIHMPKSMLPGGLDSGAIQLIRKMLKIPASEVFSKYPVQIPTEARENATHAFKELNLKEGKTVFLNPDGNSIKSLDNHRDFWELLINMLIKEGYDIVTNTKEELFPNCKYVFLPLLEAIEFVPLCGFIVSPMTGIIEAICAFNMEKRIDWHIVMGNAQDASLRNNYQAWYMNFLPILRKYGGDFSKKFLEIADKQFYKVILGDNIHTTIYQLGSTDEDKSLAEEIVKKIINK